MFVAAPDLTLGPSSPEGTEVLQTRWVPFDEAVTMSLDGRIMDALSILASPPKPSSEARLGPSRA